MVDIVKASISHFVPPPDGSKPYNAVSTEPGSGLTRNFALESYPVEIENLRGKEDSVSLDTTGFQFARAEAKHKTFLNDEEIEREYYPESIELLKKLTGANRVVIFDHTVRRHRPGEKGDSPQKRQPVSLAHVDQTTSASIARVHRHLPADEVPELLKKRFQIINLWRPISHKALGYPLALCDYRSVDPQTDLVATTLKYPDHDGETFNLRFNPNHKWKYLRGMDTDEVVLIKCFDSIQDGSVAVCTPHTAFLDPTTPLDAPLRESIELRALVFYE